MATTARRAQPPAMTIEYDGNLATDATDAPVDAVPGTRSCTILVKCPHCQQQRVSKPPTVALIEWLSRDVANRLVVAG